MSEIITQIKLTNAIITAIMKDSLLNVMISHTFSKRYIVYAFTIPQPQNHDFYTIPHPKQRPLSTIPQLHYFEVSKYANRQPEPVVNRAGREIHFRVVLLSIEQERAIW